MILRPGLIAPLALLVAMVTASVTLYAGVAEAPAAFFGDANFVLLLPPGELVPGQSSIDASLARPLGEHASVERLSAEIYAPTIVHGRSVLARGVDLDAFLAIERSARVEGAIPDELGEALVGIDLARALGIAIGDDLVVPGSKSSALVPMHVVGILHVDGPARDEIVAPLDTARPLVDLRPSDVHVIRIDPADRAAVVALVRGVGATFSYSNVSLSTSEPLPGEIVTLRAELTNWGPHGATNVSVVRGDDIVLATRAFGVAARTTQLIEIPFRVPEGGVTNVTLNPTFAVQTRAPVMLFEIDGTASAGVPLRFVLTNEEDGTPAADIQVVAGQNATRTGPAGEGAIVPSGDGVLQLRAIVDDRATAIADVFVAQKDAGDRPLARVLGAGALNSGGFVRANASPVVSIHVMNVGGVSGVVEVPVTVDDTTVATARADLAPGADAVLDVALPPLARGEHTLGFGPIAQRVTAIEGDPAIEAILVGYDAAALRGNDIGEAHADYIEQVTGNVRLAIVALSIATGVLATTAALAVLARHLGERAPVLGTLKAIGASDEAVQERAAREALAVGAGAAAIGILGGIGVALAIEATHVLHAFGHQIHPRFPWHVLALIFLLASLSVAIVTRALVRGLLRRAPDVLMRGALGP